MNSFLAPQLESQEENSSLSTHLDLVSVLVQRISEMSKLDCLLRLFEIDSIFESGQA
jgi:hypothetical protein